jgi:hypothetical protein
MDGQTDSQMNRQMEAWTKGENEGRGRTEGQMHVRSYTPDRDRWMDRRTDRQRDEQMERHTKGQDGRPWKYRWTNARKDRYTRQRERLMDRKTDRWID